MTALLVWVLGLALVVYREVGCGSIDPSNRIPKAWSGES